MSSAGQKGRSAGISTVAGEEALDIEIEVARYQRRGQQAVEFQKTFVLGGVVKGFVLV